MPHRPPFGRRAVFSVSRSAARTPVCANRILAQASAPISDPATDWSTTDPELDAWRQAREAPWHRLPWRQISWMASLCFGVASLVLPDSVNHIVSWILYALMAASFITGIRMRRAHRNAASHS